MRILLTFISVFQEMRTRGKQAVTAQRMVKPSVRRGHNSNPWISFNGQQNFTLQLSGRVIEDVRGWFVVNKYFFKEN